MHIPALHGAWSRFHPGLISGLDTYYRADRGATVSQWTDQSGAGNHATQGTAANQPAISATAHNNHYGYTFDGSNDYLVLPESFAGAKTICIAYRMSSSPGASTLRSLIRLLHGVTRSEILVVNFAGYRRLTFACDFATAGVTARGVDMAFDTDPHTIVLTYNGGTVTNSNSYRVYIDGNPWLVTSSNTVNASSDNGSATGSIGARFTGAGAQFPTPGNVFRATIHSGAMSPIDAYRMHKWLSAGFDTDPLHNPLVVCDGNSLTFGTGSTTPAGGLSPNSYPEQMLIGLGGPTAWSMHNLGVGGQTTTQMISDFVTQVAPLRRPKATKNILCAWETTNHIGAGASSGDVIGAIQAYCDAGRAAGFAVVVGDCIARGDFSGAQQTVRTAVNSSIAANWSNYADGYCALSGTFTDYTNGTLYNGDQVHLTDAGYVAAANLWLSEVSAL